MDASIDDTSRDQVPGEPSEVAVDPTQIGDHYRELASELRRRETNIASDLPIDSPNVVCGSIAQAAEELGSSKRTLRSELVLNVIEREVGERPPEEVVRCLAGLDAMVHALDDIVDNRDLGQMEKVQYAINVVFSQVFMFENLAGEHEELLADVQYDYLIELAQMPMVEERMLKRIEESSTREQRVEAAVNSYANDAKVVDGFVRIAAAVLGVPEETTERIADDVAACHARQLLFEELRQVRRDFKQGDRNPVLYLIRESSDHAQVASFIRAVDREFDYSAAGRESYGGLLRALERRPEDLEMAVIEAMSWLSAMHATEESTGTGASADGPTATQDPGGVSEADISAEFVQFTSAASSARGSSLHPATFGVLAAAKQGGSMESVVRWAQEMEVAGRDRIQSRAEALDEAGIVEVADGRLELALDAADHDQLLTVTVSALS